MKALDAQAAALSPNSYHDFAGLQALKGKAHRAGQGEAALRAAAQQFEAMFLQEIMRTMRESNIKSDLLESGAIDTFEGMFDKEVSMQMSKRGGMGLADVLVQQMKKNVAAESAPPSADAVMRLREAGGLPLVRPARAHELNPAAEGRAIPLPSREGYALPNRSPLESAVGADDATARDD